MQPNDGVAIANKNVYCLKPAEELCEIDCCAFLWKTAELADTCERVKRFLWTWIPKTVIMISPRRILTVTEKTYSKRINYPKSLKYKQLSFIDRINTTNHKIAAAAVDPLI
jgi:hypothetical protein